MTKGRGIYIQYTAVEMDWIRKHCTLARRKAHRKFCEKFEREDVSLDNFKALCKRRGWNTGRDGRYEKGRTPENKGKSCPPGKGGNHPNARKTHFQPGVRQGVATKLYKPIGTERLSKEGYLERKIHDGMPLQSRWRAVHLIRWEEINGAVPEGMCLKCLDGDRRNIDPSNWEAISRGLLPALAGRWNHPYDSLPEEVKPVALTLAKVKHASGQLAKKQKRGET